MKKIVKKFLKHPFIHHETKRHVLTKFLLILGVISAYFSFIVFEYGFESGLLITGLTWSFFVLCTPIADAGFLIDFPLRLITKFRMLYSEIIVWTIALSLNIYAFFWSREIYEKTKILSLFKHILQDPYPFWGIILISGIGTFLSIQFGDELLDIKKHSESKISDKQRKKVEFIALIFVFGITLTLYDFLLKKLGIEIPL